MLGVEILGDDEDGQLGGWAPTQPAVTPRASGTSVSRRGPDFDGSASNPGAATRPPDPPAVDLGEQSSEATWEERRDTGSIRLPHAGNDAPPDDAGRGDGSKPGDPASTVPKDEPAAEASTEPQSTRALLLSVMAGAETLGLSGVLVALVVSTSTLPTVLAYLDVESTPGEQLEVYAAVYGMGGLVALALGIAATLRLRRASHPFVRGCAGSAVVLGLLLVATAALLAIQAGGAADPTPVDGI